ncbi:PQ-loop repeat-containing protein 2 [Pleurostoma richardsiae]|uniref:PQ-loop repeat-containing protein 2 n=1 Tax=Pleurostoma richardsiae TaxID=41990 RepID=A0AA38SAM6_9PEZI|nr:PQ-loop repeat-containing protein 2 [Pleurostoma richardsiae]
MAPPTEPLNLDVEAISGIAGSISIACWVVVFSPQIIENFRRGSADGLSLHFIIVWLLGDVFNILGAVLQGVLPTMIILAVYYTIADVVLLAQCFYYRGFTFRDEVIPPSAPPKPASRQQQQRQQQQQQQQRMAAGPPDERTSLLLNPPPERRGSWSDHLEHLSPAVPLLAEEPPLPPPPPSTRLQVVAFNTLSVLMVVGAGVLGWFLSRSYYGTPAGHEHDPQEEPADGGGGDIVFDLWGQIFGYLCAALYLGSRVPQLLLNWRRKSTEGVSMLFFLFACLGNLTYVLSIFAFEPRCRRDDAGGCEPGQAAREYGRYILVNSSWLAGSLGTLLLDMGIFVQFFMYNKTQAEDDEEDFLEEEEEEGEEDDHDDRHDPRPLLQRNLSTYTG